MKRFDLIDIEEADGTLTPSVEEFGDSGRFVLFSDVEPIIADRDIKAANLQLLVEKVLDIWDARTDSAEQWAVREAVELARGLKQ